MLCPHCHKEISNNSPECPFCHLKIVYVQKNSSLNLSNLQEQNNLSDLEKNGSMQTMQANPIENTNQNKEGPMPILLNRPYIQKRKEEIQPEQEKQKKSFNTNLFCWIIIVVGIFTIAFLLLLRLTPKKNKKTIPSTSTTVTTEKSISNNIGLRSGFQFPLMIGNTTLASFFDEEENKYTDVDVTGIRFIEGEEALELANNYREEELRAGFEWVGFEYKVKFHDLQYLGERRVNPLLDSTILMDDGRIFIRYNEQEYIFKFTSIYQEEGIKNEEEAIVKVLYQMLAGKHDYSICLGNRDETIGCFQR